MTSAQFHWGTFAGNRKKGKTTRYCAVGKHSPNAYFSLVPNCIRPLLKPDTDALLLDWQVDPIIQFSCHVLQGVSSQFERPFLKASHQLGNVSSTGYQAWLRNLLVLVNQWDARPELVVSKSVVYGSIVLSGYPTQRSDYNMRYHSSRGIRQGCSRCYE